MAVSTMAGAAKRNYAIWNFGFSRTPGNKFAN